MEDLALKAKMTNVTVGVQKEGVREVMQIDEKVSCYLFPNPSECPPDQWILISVGFGN